MVKAKESFSSVFAGMDLTRRKIEPREKESTEAEISQAIREWSDFGYMDVRAGENPYLESMLEKHVQGNNYTGKMYRGIQTNDPINFTKGMVIDQLGKLSSWTRNESVARGFSDDSDYPNHYIFVLQNGSSNSRDISKNSEFESEAEVLMSGKCIQRVVRVDNIKPGYKRVYLEDCTDEYGE